MPVHRFRDVSEMPDGAYLDKSDPRFIERIAALWTFSSQLTGELPVPRGVQRFRSLEELNESRLHWDRARIEVLRERRKSPSA